MKKLIFSSLLFSLALSAAVYAQAPGEFGDHSICRRLGQSAAGEGSHLAAAQARLGAAGYLSHLGHRPERHTDAGLR